jgi:hypothetical protein
MEVIIYRGDDKTVLVQYATFVAAWIAAGGSGLRAAGSRQ